MSTVTQRLPRIPPYVAAKHVCNVPLDMRATRHVCSVQNGLYMNIYVLYVWLYNNLELYVLPPEAGGKDS